MTNYIEHKLKNGSLLRVNTHNAEVALAAIDFYESNGHLPWECPFCENDHEWDNLCYETDGDNFEDTYKCDACDTMITFITPKDAGEYHNVLPCETTYEIDFMWSGGPSTWGQEEESDEGPLSLTDHCPQCQDAPDYYECSYCGKTATPPVVADDQPKLL